jgi:DNA (cytosine-5)-methyltransferase 1
MKYLSLFSGGMGGDLGMQHLLGWRCLGYVEWEKYCQKLIRQRQDDGLIDRAPIFGDIREFISDGYAGAYKGMVDVITGGFPCQPFSVAGKQAREDDPRNMWPKTIEAIRIIQPRYAFLENVKGLTYPQRLIVKALEKVRQLSIFSQGDKLKNSGHIIRHIFKVAGLSYFGRVLGDLAESGYDAKWCVLGADDVGAPHERKRLWIMAYRSDQGLSECGQGG